MSHATSLRPFASPAAGSPGKRFQLASFQRLFLLKTPSHPGGISRISQFGDWTKNRRYLCHAISEKPPAAAARREDAAAGAKGTQVTISVGFNGSERAVTDVYLPERTSERNEQSDGSEKDLNGRIAKVKEMLRSMGDGEISLSAYDTAWVALIPNLNGTGGPQFPSSLKWIAENQLPDGSWGDDELFIAHDRLINTLACVIALKSWGVNPEGCQRGISFLSVNMKRLDEEDLELMPIGFEVAFPSLVEIAMSMNLDIPFHCPGLEEINARKSLKLKRFHPPSSQAACYPPMTANSLSLSLSLSLFLILSLLKFIRIPKDMLHQVPTTLLHSLEGMSGLEWEKILRLQCADGSLLFSPSSTAFAVMCTGDRKCFDYLQRIVRRFNGGVPNVYPVDLFERLWAVDRLERLGISRYFGEEIRQCLDYVYNHWTDDGISWARFSTVQDVDDTAMGFRLLRLHGYDVSPDVFRRFKKDGEFFCLPGQSTQAVTGMYNLSRAAQVSYPGEEILLEARKFSNRYLQKRRALDKLTDKWIITKDLPGEVKYALEFPWYTSLPRVEARFYLEQYGGESDVWIGKTLYRMPYVNNDDFLELARLDFQRCQARHKVEWLALQRWFEESGLNEHGVSEKDLLAAYFLAAASVFEPDRAAERLGWARTTVLAVGLSAHLASFGGDRATECLLDEMWRWLNTCSDGIAGSSFRSGPENWEESGLFGCLLHTMEVLASDACPSPSDTHSQIRRHLGRAWINWVQAWLEEDDDTGLLVVRTLELCAGRTALEESLLPVSRQASKIQKWPAQLARLISSISRRLRLLNRGGSLSPGAMLGDGEDTSGELDPDMQELAQLVLRNSSGEGGPTRQNFLIVAKSLHYVANCSPAAFQLHVDKVLFQAVI